MRDVLRVGRAAGRDGFYLALGLEVGGWGEAGLLAEGGGEGAGRLVANMPGDGSDGLPGGKRGQRGLQPNQAPPLAEGRPGIGEEGPGQGSCAGADLGAPVSQRPLVRGVGEQPRCDLCGAFIIGIRTSMVVIGTGRSRSPSSASARARCPASRVSLSR
jgi:hypothetical protein